MRVQSPAVGAPTPGPAPSSSNNLEDLLGVFGDGNNGEATTSGPNYGGSSGADLLNGFSGLDLSGNAGSAAPPATNQKKTNEDIMSLF